MQPTILFKKLHYMLSEIIPGTAKLQENKNYNVKFKSFDIINI